MHSLIRRTSVFARLRTLALALALLLAPLLGLAPEGVAQAASGDCVTSGGQVTCSFSYTGAAQTWTVPAGVTRATFDVFGAQGGGTSGRGGQALATIDVTPGASYQITVGGRGSAGRSDADHSAGGAGGFNGGGSGGNGENMGFVGGGGGGGASDVHSGACASTTSCGLLERVIVGGGGGGGTSVRGGDGGGLVGGDGQVGLTFDPSIPPGGGGSGGSQTAGGRGGSGHGGSQTAGGAGAAGIGGNGGNGSSLHWNGAGGGGGGYYGGGGGIHDTIESHGGGGGGGSGYGPAGVVFHSGARTGDGLVTITYTAPDSTAPTASPTQAPAANSAGWNTSDVTVTWNWSDNAAGSGIDPANCTQSSTASGEGTLTLTATCQDLAGNQGSSSYTVKVDQTAPTLAPAVSPNVVLLGGTATATSGAADALSGLASQSCGSLDTSSLGTKSVSCTASDNAGNTSSASVSYNVVYNWSGFAQPVDAAPTLNVASAGRAIPLKWRLTDANGSPVTNLTSVTLTAASLACSVGTTPDQVEEYAAGGSGLQNLGDGYYQLNWTTPKSYAGSCKTLKLDLGEGLGNERTALFQFK